MKKLICILILTPWPVLSSLIQIFGLNPDVIYDSHLTREKCKQFEIVSALRECKKIVLNWESIARRDTSSRRKKLHRSQQRFLQKIAHLNDLNQNKLQENSCFQCNELGIIDPLNENNIQLFQDIFSCNLTDDSRTELFCHCVNKRTKLLEIQAPSEKDSNRFNESWGKQIGKMVSGMIYSTIAEIGDAVAEVSITGRPYNHNNLPSCDITQMRKTIEKLQHQGCSSGVDVNKRLALLFPDNSIDEIITGFEKKTIELVDPGIPSRPDPPGECRLPKQYLAIYRKADKSKTSRCIMQAIKVLQKVIPENIILDIYRQGVNDPFNQVLEYTYNSSIPLPPEINEVEWSNVINFLAHTGNGILGGKLFYNLQSWEGVRTVYNSTQDIKASTDFSDCQKPDSNLSALLQSDDFNREYERNLEKKCHDIFGELLEKAICDPLGAPLSHHQLDLGDTAGDDYLINEQLYCQEERNGALKLMGSKSYVFAQNVPLDNLLDLLYFQEEEYQQFNALCPLLKECEPDTDFCTVRSFASITDEEYAKLSKEDKKIVDRYKVAEEMIGQFVKSTRSVRSEPEVTEASADDSFSELWKSETDLKSTSGQTEEEIIQSEKEKLNKTPLPHFMRTKEEQIEIAVEHVKSTTTKEVSKNYIGNQPNHYKDDFVNQLIFGAKPIVSLKTSQTPIIPLRPSTPVTKKIAPQRDDPNNKQTSMLQDKIDILKETMGRLEESEKSSQQISQLRRDYQEREYQNQQLTIKKERASIGKERQLVQDATRQQKEQNINLKRQLENDHKIRELQEGLEKTQSSYQTREEQHQEQIDQLSSALRKQGNLSQQKDEEARALKTRLQEMINKEVKKKQTGHGNRPQTLPRASSRKKQMRNGESKVGTVIATGNSGHPSTTQTKRQPAHREQQTIPTIASEDYISLNREVNILEQGVSSETPNFNLKTYDIHGNQIEIPMRAEFDSRGHITRIIPDLKPEHHALINSIRDRTVRENLIGLVEKNSGVQIISENNFLKFNEKQLIANLKSSTAFNVLVRAKDGTHMIIPFQVLRRGESSENVRIHLDYQNYPWMKDSLARIKNVKVLEKIYLQMEAEDQR